MSVWKKVYKTLQPCRWTRFPQVIQIDTNNFCGPEYCGILCQYCYPQWKISQGRKQHMEMPLEIIELILKQAGKYGRREMDLMDLFLNGDGLTEPRLPEIHRLSKKYLPGVPTQTFTNGILFENIDALMSLDRMCFTISAHKKELYKRIHGGDGFDKALKPLSYVLENKKKEQLVEVHYIITKDNAKYIQNWWDFFGENYPGAVRILSPLVASYDNFPSKNALGELTLDEQETLVIKTAGEKGRMWTRGLIPDQKPCVLWDNMSIDVGGAILQCCNWSPPEDVNYGNVYEMEKEGYTLKDAWTERLANKMRNSLCRSCNMKHSQWRKRLSRMVIKTKIRG